MEYFEDRLPHAKTFSEGACYADKALKPKSSGQFHNIARVLTAFASVYIAANHMPRVDECRAHNVATRR